MHTGLTDNQLPEHDRRWPATTADQSPPFDSFPLSFAQQRLWFLQQLEPQSVQYNVPAALRLRGPLDVAALQHSLQTIVARHEALRTTFALIDEQPMQLVWPQRTLALARIDLRAGHDSAACEAAALRLAIDEARTPFDLQRGPLLRATLLQLAPDGACEQHLLLLTLHHIVADGWSVGVFVHELASCYAAQLAGQAAELPELPIQYADFAVWQREQLQGPALEAQLDYWRAQLGGPLPLLELPTDLPAQAADVDGARHSFRVEQPISAALSELSRREGVTLFMTLLAAFDVLLYRSTGQTDLLVGTPIANRSQAELEPLIGFFSNTLVLRSNLSDDPSFRALLGRVRETTLAAYEHQDLPFEKLVEVLQPERDLSRNPLFQVMFAMQNTPLPPLQLGDLALTLVNIDPGTAKFDLLLSAYESQRGLELTLEYRQDRFSVASIERLAGHYTTLLQGIVAEPQQPISRLPLLPAAERRRILHDWNATAAPIPASVVELFEQQAARTPDAVAVLFGQQQLSYRELSRRANQLAHYLRSLGVGGHAQGETRVGICVERSLELPIAVLAVLKAGGAYVPLDPTYPAERLQFMIRQSRAALILTQQTIAHALPADAAPTVCLDRDWPAIARQPASDPAVTIQPDQLAYVIYTSGSTGQPKGVAMPHRALSNLIGWHQSDAALGQAARTLQFAPISFDVSFQELFSCWLSGGTLLLIDEQLRRDAPALLRYLEHMAVERLLVPFVALQQLAEAAAASATDALRLRQILTAGEQLQISSALADWLRRLPGTTLHNHYGPTESHVVTTFVLAGDPRGWPTLPPIGGPVANTQLYVLDAQLEPQPIGVTGELYIGGAQLARGYLDQPALTAARFVPDPLSECSGARLYRTGDLARLRADGMIEFLGRADDQLKVRGYRIEPAEIEAVLRQHPAVRDVAVIGQRQRGQMRLVAYVVEEPGIKNQEPGSGTEGSQFLVLGSELRAFLAERLPEYMLPSLFLPLPALPLTPSGKLDRRALPQPEAAVLEQRAEAAFVAPRDALEQRLAAIWTEVLQIAPIGIHDNFFAIGGHSLLATQINLRIRSAFKVELPLRAHFEAPTIALLARQIAALGPQQSGLAPRQIAVLPRDQADRFPLSFAQQRLWFLHQLNPESVAYNIPAALRLRGSLDVAALRAALDALVARHETLRTTFAQSASSAGQPVQIIGQPYAVALPLIDLRGLDQPQREARVAELAGAEARTPFDLQRGPLLRVQLLRLADREQVLLLTLHHIIADGWSMHILIDELAGFYRAASAADPSAALGPVVGPLAVQYADFAAWQRATLEQPAALEQIGYWKRQLANAPTVLELPIALPRQPDQTIESATHSFALPPTLTATLSELSQREQATLFMTLLAAFAVLLQRYSGQTDLLIGTPTAGRTRPEIEPLIGFFINTLVLRADLSGDPRFVELLGRVRETALQAYAHQDVPFEQLVREVQPERALHQQPLVQAVFVFQSSSLRPPSLPGLELSTLAGGDETAKFDLTLMAEVVDQRLQAVFKYNRALFPPAAIERLATHYTTLLQGIAAEPQQLISRLPLLPAAERRRILHDWNATAAPVPIGCYHELFAAQAARTPDAVAVLFGGQQLSYRELNRRANQLAHHLRSLGVTLETRVGICVERSPELVMALLGVLKAGGAYVPLDPAYPAERLQFMLDDAGVTVLLTQQRFVSALPADAAPTVCLDRDWPAIAQQPASDPPSVSSIANLAYVIYTSGSTGVPKGVMVTHEGIGNLAQAQIDDFGLGVGSRVLQFVSFSFDGAVSEFVMALLSGATLCLALPGSALPGPELVEQLRTQAVTTMKMPPSVLAALPAAELPALRTVISAGEPLSAELVRRWIGSAAGGRDRRFFNAYGPSENTVCATIGPCSDDEPRPHVGRPLPNKQIYLLDAQMQPVPIGVPGELHIGGIGLARGYLDRPALTAERFVPNPFGEPSSKHQAPNNGTTEHGEHFLASRLYKTGDLARLRDDGNIEFVGRVDQQVKVRGFRIELGEIEAVLRQHAAVREAVAIVREDEPGERRLVAYVVGENQAPRTENQAPRAGSHGTKEQTSNGTKEQEIAPLHPSELRAFLAQRLPGYMIPAVFVPLDALPLTANGKLDRDALPAPSHVRPELETSFVAAQSWTEQTLARIWADVLRLEQIGIHDNFFDLGGDSILSIQITARANQAGLRLTPRQLFEHQTIAELAAAVGTQRALEAEQTLVLGPVPLTPIQRRFFEQQQPQPQHWNQSLLLAARAPLDAERLAEALQLLLTHHDALRLRFVRAADGWQQHHAEPAAAAPLVTLDLRGLSQAAQTAAIERAAAEWQARLDLAEGPLFQAVLFDLGSERGARLLLAVHHLVVDGVSWRVLLEDLQALYGQLAAGATAQLPPKTSSFKQWAERLLAYARSDALHAERLYWRDALPTQLARLPLDDPSGRAFNTEGTARSIALALDADETRALLQEVPQVYHTQINDLLLTALALACHRQWGLRPLLIDLEGQGREPLFDDLDVSRTVGWFTTVFPVVLTLPDQPDLGAALRAIKEQLRRIPQRGIGYGLLRYLSQPPTIQDELRSQPPAELGFNYLGQFDQLFDASALLQPAPESPGPQRAAEARRAHLIDVNAGVFAGCLRVDWLYSPALHQPRTIEQLAQRFIEALRELIGHCLHSDAGGYTPSDFSAFNWSQTDLEDITSSIGKLMGESE